MNLQKNKTTLFLFNELSDEEGTFICLCEAAQFSKDPGQYSVLLQPMPVQFTCVHTLLGGRGRRLHSVTQWCSDSFLCPWKMLLLLGWLNYLPPSIGNMLRMLKKIKIVGAHLRCELCPSTPVNLVNFFFSSKSRLHLPALALSMPECFQLHAYLSTAESLISLRQECTC